MIKETSTKLDKKYFIISWIHYTLIYSIHMFTCIYIQILKGPIAALKNYNWQYKTNWNLGKQIAICGKHMNYG